MIRICNSVQIIVLCVFVHPSDAFKTVAAADLLKRGSSFSA